MSALNAMLYREAKIRFTNFAWVFWDLFYPLGYLLVFGVGINAAMGPPTPALGVDYNAFFLAGVLGVASLGIAQNTAWGFFVDRDNGIFYEMLTYPLSRAEYLLGKVLFTVFIALLQTAITLGLGALALRIPLRVDLLPLLLLAVAGGTAGWFFFYAIFALWTRRNDVFNSVTSVFYFVFLFASSMFYPLEPLPAWFRGAALVNPVTWQVDLMRYLSIGYGDPRTIALETAAFTVFCVASFVIAVRFLQEQE